MLLEGKTVLVTGILNRRSLGYGVAKAVAGQGGRLILTHQAGEQFEGRLRKIAEEEFAGSPILECDVSDDASVAAAMESAGKSCDTLDGLVHSVAYAPRESLTGKFHECTDREGFALAHGVSAYSLVALAKGAEPLMRGNGGSIVAMSYIGSTRAIPNYNLMGVAKASLEACARYLAHSMGELGVRVNVVSPGPVKTLAASAIGDIGAMLEIVRRQAPLGRNTTIEDVGNAAAFLLSDLSSSITGEVIHVDSGFHLTAMTPDKPATPQSE